MLVDKLQKNPQIEFNEEIAQLLPSVILKLLGLSEDYFPKLRGWSAAFMEGIGVPYADMAAKARRPRHGRNERRIRCRDRSPAQGSARGPAVVHAGCD